MNFSNFFISRPIFATVLAIILTLVGAMAMRILPIEQYPSVVPPTVSVQAQFPGADAETVAQTVAAPLAEAINGVEDILYMTSNSADNGLTISKIKPVVASRWHQTRRNARIGIQRDVIVEELIQHRFQQREVTAGGLRIRLNGQLVRLFTRRIPDRLAAFEIDIMLPDNVAERQSILQGFRGKSGLILDVVSHGCLGIN